ncbi:MAG: hypothetical protein ACOVN5_02925 [Aquidulcibacter sp.]
MAIETDMGLSDEGDPWFVFYSTQTEDVVAHFARLDGQIVVHGLSAGGVVSGVDLNDVVRRLGPIQAMEAQQRVRRDGSVVLHPFMILVAFVAASFLASEESQAASLPNEGGSAAAADRATEVAKIKSDWIDRAMTLLQSKSKDRVDALSADTTPGRKFVPQDTTQHSMALVMLAAAISQAKADVADLSDDVTDSLSVVKYAPAAAKLVADPVTTQNDVVSALDATIPTPAKLPTMLDADASDHGGLVHLSNLAATSVLPSAGDVELSLPVGQNSTLPTAPNVTPSLALGSSVIFGPDQQPLSLPETVPSISVLAPGGSSGTLIGKAIVSTLTLAVPSSSGFTSFDLFLNGETLQFNQSINLIDMRAFDLMGTEIKINQEQAGLSEDNITDSVNILVVAESGKTLLLSDARESILVSSGDIRIRNFTFGVDQLVLESSDVMSKAPEVLFSYAGDVIIKFNESTKVTLLGVFAPGDLIASMASVSPL